MRRILLPLALVLLAAPAAANPLAILKAASKAASVAANSAKVAAKGAAVAAKGAAKAGTAAKIGKVALGGTALLAADDAARLFARIGDDGLHTALFLTPDESGALRLLGRSGDQGLHALAVVAPDGGPGDRDGHGVRVAAGAAGELEAVGKALVGRVARALHVEGRRVTVGSPRQHE